MIVFIKHLVEAMDTYSLYLSYVRIRQTNLFDIIKQQLGVAPRNL